MIIAQGTTDDLDFKEPHKPIRDQNTLTLPEREEKAWLMGFIAGDGTVTKNKNEQEVICFPGHDLDVALHCQKLYEMLYGVTVVVQKLADGYKVITRQKLVYDDLISICPSWDTYSWSVPFSWFKTPEEKAQFVSGWIDADGNQGHRNPPSGSSVNKKGVYQVSELLKSLDMEHSIYEIKPQEGSTIVRNGKERIIQSKENSYRLCINKKDEIRKLITLAPFRSKHKLQRAQHYVNGVFLYLKPDQRSALEQKITEGVSFDTLSAETGYSVEEIAWVDQSRTFMRKKNGPRLKEIEEILPKAEAMYAAGATRQEVIDALSPDGSDITQALKKRGVRPIHQVPYGKRGLARAFNYPESQCFEVIQRELSCFNVSLEGIDYYSLNYETVKLVPKPVAWFRGVGERTWHRLLLTPRIVRLVYEGFSNSQIATIIKARPEFPAACLKTLRNLIDPEAITQRDLKPATTRKKVESKSLVGRTHLVKDIELQKCQNPECPIPDKMFKGKYKKKNKYCEECASTRPSQGWTTEKLFEKAKEVVQLAGKYTTAAEVVEALQISLGTLSNYGVRITEVNRACGFVLDNRGEINVRDS